MRGPPSCLHFRSVSLQHSMHYSLPFEIPYHYLLPIMYPSIFRGVGSPLLNIIQHTPRNAA